MKIKFLVLSFLISFSTINCDDSSVASANISTAAHQFEIFRRVVFYNGITGQYILEIQGYCSVIPETDGRLSVIIKTEEGTYLKHYLGLSDNVTYFCEQLTPRATSDKQYRVVFKPSVIVPEVDLR